MNITLFEGKKIEELNLKTGVKIISFFATWCGPCKMFGFVLEEVVKENKEINVIKIDIDKNKEIAQNNNIQSVPTTFIYKDGKLIEKISGFIAKEVLTTKIEAIL